MSEFLSLDQLDRTSGLCHVYRPKHDFKSSDDKGRGHGSTDVQWEQRRSVVATTEVAASTKDDGWGIVRRGVHEGRKGH